MGEALTVSEFTTSDSDEVIRLWEQCGLISAQNNPRKDIQRKLKQGREFFLVGKMNSRLVAAVMGGYDGHRGWMNYLAVEPSSQRLGFATQIIDALETRMRAVGCAKINLQVRSNNRSVIEFYRTLGFAQDDVVSLGKRLAID